MLNTGELYLCADLSCHILNLKYNSYLLLLELLNQICGFSEGIKLQLFIKNTFVRFSMRCSPFKAWFGASCHPF